MKALDKTNLKNTINNWAAKSLDHYTEKLKAAPSISVGKDINDSVWGTIAVTPAEYLLLDSPVFQRMRRIKQLGCVHWVYPGAVHSRFEHTLGVLHNTQVLIDAFRRSASAQNLGASPLTEDWQRLLRLAGICHDVGHLAFSHVSEKALHGLPEVIHLRTEVSNELGLDHSKPLSELISALIVLSPAFGRLLEVIAAKTKTMPNSRVLSTNDSKSVQQIIADAILGKELIEQIPLLQELISGPFDADKMDYIVRDAMYSGVSVSIDASRLLQKIQVVRRLIDDAPAVFRDLKPDDNQCLWFYGVKSSGRNALDELHLARALLFSKVYRHQKTMAIEGLISNSLRSLRRVYGSHGILAMLLKMDDDQILSLASYDDKTIKRILGSITESRIEPNLDAQQELRFSQWKRNAQRLRERSLPVRAFCFQPDFWANDHEYPKIDDDRQTYIDRYIRFFRRMSDGPEYITDIKSGIIELASEIISLTRDKPSADDDQETLDLDLWLTRPSDSKVSEKLGNAYVVTSDDRLVLARDDGNINGEAWSGAYGSTFANTYLYAPREFREEVYLATHVYVCSTQNITLPEKCASLAKIDEQRCSELIDKLAAKNFFERFPPYVKPLTKWVRKKSIIERINNLDKKFGSLDLAAPEFENVKSDKVYLMGTKTRRILYHANYMPTEEMAKNFLSLLDGVRVFRRIDVNETISEFFKVHPEFTGTTLCTLGSGKDSSSVVGYQSADRIGDGAVKRVSDNVQEALIHGSDSIVFIDDFSSSGRQAVTILKGWLGVDNDDEEELGEERLPLTHELADQLRTKKIALVFTILGQEGKARLLEFAQDESLDITVYGKHDQASVPNVNSVLDQNHVPISQREALQTVLENRTRTLLNNINTDPEKTITRLFGYGNHGLLISFSYNVPAQALTYLWRNGPFGDGYWEPLFYRRKKA